MHIKSTWSYIHKGLLVILSLLIVSSMASILYLTHSLQNLQTLTYRSSQAVGTAFVLQDLLINLTDVQTGVRGYVLTGDQTFLEPYNLALSRIPSDIKIIKTDKNLLLSDTQAATITRLAFEQQNILQNIKETRDTRGFEAAQSVVASGGGEKITEDLRREVIRISSSNLQVIGPLQRKSEADIRRALWVAAVMALFVLGTSAAVIWYFKRAILQERALESTKNEFLSLASHQLRTPATNVKQYVGLLLDGYMGDLSAKQRQALEVAYRNNEAEINIMNDLLDVAKLDLNRIQLHKKVTDVTRIARGVIREYNPAAKQHRHSIRLDGPKQVMAAVDDTYVKGILENLLDNAIKYSPDGIEIVISVTRDRDSVCIDVIDKGLGIKKRDISKLFNKFSRLDNEFSANSQGSGLGLYWVKQIVRLHGGTITVSSSEGQGSVFSVRLPVR